MTVRSLSYLFFQIQWLKKQSPFGLFHHDSLALTNTGVPKKPRALKNSHYGWKSVGARVSNLKYQFPEGISVLNLFWKTCKCVVQSWKISLSKSCPRFHPAFYLRMMARVIRPALLFFSALTCDKQARSHSDLAACFSTAFSFVLIPVAGAG